MHHPLRAAFAALPPARAAFTALRSICAAFAALQSVRAAFAGLSSVRTAFTLLIAAAAILFVLTGPAAAQSFTPAPDYGAVQLFQTVPGQSLAGLDFDSSGKVYYLLSDFGQNTRLESRSPADNYTQASVLYTYSSPVFGSFVRADSDRIYFGESSTGTIRTFDLQTSALNLLATVDFNYDLAIFEGTGWLSASPNGGNSIFKLNLSTGTTEEVLTSMDYSGPVALDSLGRLYYGATQYGAGGGIFRYNAGEANSGGLTLDAPHLWFSNAGNAYFSADGIHSLFQTDFASVNRLDTETGVVTVLGSSTDFVGQLASADGALVLSVTAFGAPGSDQSAVYQLVPEPAAMTLLLAGVGAVAIRRKRV